MKQFRCLLIFFLLLLAGCTKEPVTPEAEPTGQGPTYTPRGNVAVYVDSLGVRLFRETDTVSTHLCFAVYDTSGVRVKQTNQKVGDSHYGAVGFQLEDGSYRLVVVAHSSRRNPTMTDPSRIQFNNGTGYSDTYLYSTLLDVTPSQQKVHVAPRRITALCRFVVGDTIPDSVATLRFRYTGGSGHFDAASGAGVTQSTQEVIRDVRPGQTDTRFDLYTVPLGTDEDTLQLTVAALNAEGGKVLERQFAVPVRCDQITWLCGNFFSTGGWTITPATDIDSDWGSEVFLTY